VIVALDPVLQREFPDVRVEWFQRGSEDVAARVNAEIAAGRVAADIVMTSDPFWYQELKEGGHLLAMAVPEAATLPAELTDPDGVFTTVRMPVMVLAANPEVVPRDQQPARFADLTAAEWKGRVTMGDPNRSGSMFTAVAALSARYGWEYFEGLRANDILVAGGNSAVLSRIVTGERPVGIVLLENVLQALQATAGAPIDVIYPADGVILVPSPIAVLAATDVPDGARRLVRFFLSETGQRALVAGWMYSPLESVAPPAGARPWAEIYHSALQPWSPAYGRDVSRRREAIKRRFNEVVLN